MARVDDVGPYVSWNVLCKLVEANSFEASKKAPRGHQHWAQRWRIQQALEKRKRQGWQQYVKGKIQDRAAQALQQRQELGALCDMTTATHHHTSVGEAYRTAILQAASRMPKRQRHSYLRQRVYQIRAAHARVEQRQPQHNKELRHEA